MATWTELGTRSRRSAQAQTEADPVAKEDGITLYGVGAITPAVRAPNGQSFDGSGTLEGWVYSDLLAKWLRAPRADTTLEDCATENEVILDTIPVPWGIGKFALIAKGVGLSGGTVVTIDFLASERIGGTQV